MLRSQQVMQSDRVIVSSNKTWRGAAQIALNVLGEDTPRNRRRIYNWLERVDFPHRPVVYKMAGIVCMDAQDYFGWLETAKLNDRARSYKRKKKLAVTAANDTGATDESAA
ncbi:MAG: hypothetical protein ACOVQ6_08270 [Brevundimonas sp.]